MIEVARALTQSGCSLLYTVIFVAFDKEEVGMAGMRRRGGEKISAKACVGGKPGQPRVHPWVPGAECLQGFGLAGVPGGASSRLSKMGCSRWSICVLGSGGPGHHHELQQQLRLPADAGLLDPDDRSQGGARGQGGLHQPRLQDRAREGGQWTLLIIDNNCVHLF